MEKKIFFLAPFFQRIGWLVRPQIMFSLYETKRFDKRIRGAPINRFIFMRWFNVRFKQYQMFINISNLLMILKSNRGGEHFTSPKKFQHFHQSHLTKKKTPPKNTETSQRVYLFNYHKTCHFWTSFFWDQNHKNV